MSDLMKFARHVLNTQKGRDLVSSGSTIFWAGPDGKEHGPAYVRGTFRDGGQLWCWLSFEGIERLINAKLVTKINRNGGRTVLRL